MQNVSTPLYQILSSFQRDLTPVDLFEFYAPDVTDLIPGNATKRFAGTSMVWYGWEYEQQAISRGDVSRYMNEKFNSVNITLSNVDRSVGNWLSTVSLEGWRVVIRMVSRSITDDSVVLFVGRLEKPGDIENARITLTAKQDLGTIENEIPFRKFDLKCPLKFKGEECLAGQAITEKTQKYQEAGSCNKSWSQCFEYGNVKAFQGFRYKAVVGSFKVNSRSTGVSKVFGSRRATKQWTSTDNVPIGESVPVGMGRTQIDLTPVLYADTGQYLYGHFIAGEGKIADFADVRNTSAGWATTFQFKAEHKGQYGYEPDQATDSELLGAEHYSHRAYVEATIEGNNPDTGDPAPVLAALILWQKMASLGGGCFDSVEWSDNPVEHVRALLTDPRALGYPENWIDDEVAVDTANYCNEPMIDESGCEEFWYDQNNGVAGLDWKRYRSTGVLDWPYYKYLLGETTVRPQTLGPDYNAYDPENPPEDPPVTTFYRKRYTSNWHLKEPVKVADFLFKHLLPSFRGYLVTGADGKLQIKSERPAVSSFLRNAISPGDSSIAVEDVTSWQRLAVNQLFVLIGAGQDTSETRRVTGIEYSSAGNSITLSVTQGATAYAATFTGGSASTQAWNYFTVTSAATTAPAIVVIDGVTITGGGVDGQGNPSTIGSVAGELAARINANPTLNRYIEAVWTPENFAIVTLKAKLGILQIDSGVTYSHGTNEKAVHVYGVFADEAMGALDRSNIIRDSFKWPLGSRQSSYNQFSITYTDSVQDFQQTELRENDYDHQEKVNKINKLDISGACVDNYHQADRLVQAARYKYRDGDFFCSFQTSGVSLLLEEGDVICVTHANMAGKPNQLFRIEELRVTQDHRVNIVARLYSDEQFPESANVRTVGLNTGSVWIAKAPPAVTDATIVYTTIDSGRVEFDFGLFVGGQTARIEIKRPGDASFLPFADVVPDGLGRGATEIPALEPNTEIRITPISSNGVAGSSTTLTATSPLYVWPASYPPSSGYVLASDTDGNLSWVAQSGGGGTPGGSNTQVQYNDGGAFGGDSGLTYDETNKNLTVGNELRLSDDDASNYIALKAPSSLTSNVTLTLPGNDGDANQVLITDGSGGLSWSTPSAGTSLTLSTQSPTTSDITGAVNTRYRIDISGLTATRSITIPTGTAGDIIEISISNGDDAYELIVKGASTVTINGGSAATEWSRLFITNEFVQLVAVSSTAWIVTVDGRIPAKAVVNYPGVSKGTISSVSGNTITLSATHGLAANDVIFFTGTPGTNLPSGISTFNGVSRPYFVKSPSGATLQIGESNASSTVVTLTSTNSGGSVFQTLKAVSSNFNLFPLSNITSNVGDLIDSTNNRIKCRRPSFYTVAAFAQYHNTITSTAYSLQALLGTASANGSNDAAAAGTLYGLANLYSTFNPAVASNSTFLATTGLFIYINIRQESGITVGALHWVTHPYVTVTEVL